MLTFTLAAIIVTSAILAAYVSMSVRNFIRSQDQAYNFQLTQHQKAIREFRQTLEQCRAVLDATTQEAEELKQRINQGQITAELRDKEIRELNANLGKAINQVHQRDSLLTVIRNNLHA